VKLVIRISGLAALAVLGLALVIPSGGTAAKKRVPALLTYKAMVHVAGGVTFTSHKDDFKNCLPGQRWTLREDSDVDIRGNLLIETMKNFQVRSSPLIVPGAAENKNSLQKYEESNNCPPDEPVRLEAPRCKSFTGKGSVSLRNDARRRGPKRVSIGLARITGGRQDIDCTWGLSSVATPTGAQVEQFSNVYASTVLPLDITIKQLRTLGVKKKLIRTIRIGGDCSGPIVYRGKKIPSDTTNMKDGDCVVDGDFVITIKRLNRISKKGVPVG